MHDSSPRYDGARLGAVGAGSARRELGKGKVEAGGDLQPCRVRLPPLHREFLSPPTDVGSDRALVSQAPSPAESGLVRNQSLAAFGAQGKDFAVPSGPPRPPPRAARTQPRQSV